MVRGKKITKKRFSLVKLEDKLFKWVKKRRRHFFTLLLYGVFLAAFSALPYLNLLLNKSALLFVTVILTLIIFKVSIKRIVILSLSLILFGLPLILLERYETAELLSNFAYGILLLSVLKMVAGGDSD